MRLSVVRFCLDSEDGDDPEVSDDDLFEHVHICKLTTEIYVLF